MNLDGIFNLISRVFIVGTKCENTHLYEGCTLLEEEEFWWLTEILIWAFAWHMSSLNEEGAGRVGEQWTAHHQEDTKDHSTLQHDNTFTMTTTHTHPTTHRYNVQWPHHTTTHNVTTVQPRQSYTIKTTSRYNAHWHLKEEYNFINLNWTYIFFVRLARYSGHFFTSECR